MSVALTGVAMRIESLETLQDKLNPDVWRGLRRYLESVRTGQPKDYVTPLLSKEKRSNQLAFAQELLNKMVRTDIQLLKEIEEKEALKFGPFSIRDPWALRKPLVEKYFSQVEVKSSISLRKAFLQLAKLIPAHSLTALDLDDSFHLSPKGKNLGLPAFSSDRKYEKSYLKKAKQIAAKGYIEDTFDAVIGWRGQPNGSTVHIKNRTVWMMSHVETYVATGVVNPLLAVLKIKPGFAAWNDLSYVDKRITRMMDRAKHNILSVDFSGYDQSLPSTIIRLAFDLLRLWFKERDAKRITWLERQFLSVGLVTPDGIYRGRDGGVPSGSGLTNLIDSLGQILAMFAACIDLGYTIRDFEVLGDDGAFSYDQLIDVERMSSYFQDLYGMSVSSDKGGFSIDSVQFLQRLHYRGYRRHGLCVGVRSLIRTLNGMCHLERLHRGLKPEFFSARLIMQCENARHHPNFRALVKYIFLHDRYLRHLDPAEVFKRAGGVGFVEDVLGLRSFRFTDELPSRGLNEFDTVIELRRLLEVENTQRAA